MRLKSLLVSADKGRLFLVVGESEGVKIQPDKWQLPVIPNEIEDYNIEKVVKRNLDAMYNLTLDKIIDRPENSDLTYVSVKESTLSHATRIVDDEEPSYTVEHRKFITKKQLVELFSSQDTLLADKLMGF